MHKEVSGLPFRKEGVHLYPGADKDPALATGDWDDVSFLGIAHRHIFHFPGAHRGVPQRQRYRVHPIQKMA